MPVGEQNKVVSESSSPRSSTGAKKESDLEAQSPVEIPKSAEKQDPNLVSTSKPLVT